MDLTHLTPRAVSEIFKKSALHQTALWTLTSELQRKQLVWNNTKEKTGRNVYQFTTALIRSFMAFGYAVWKVTRSGKLMVADPEICVVQRGAGGKWKVVSVSSTELSSRGWRCFAFVEPPLHIKAPRCADWPSPTVMSYPHYVRVQDIEENWLRRDTHNSYPSVFTTIALEHFSHTPGTKKKPDGPSVVGVMPAPTFYRNIDKYGKAAFTDTFEPNPTKASGKPPIKTGTRSSFKELADLRHDAVRNLSQKSTLEREAILSGRDNGLAWDPMLDENRAAPLHEEHIINDGKKAVETKVLLSSADARLQYDRTRHAVLFALGVPPQAVGETVNSERTASSAAIYDVAIGLFLRTVDQYRKAVQAVLRDATTLDDGNFVTYSYGVSGIQLTRVMPLVKTSVAIQLLSQSYNLPESFFDKQRVAAMQDVDKSGNKTPGKGPQKQLETVAATPTQQGQAT